MSKFIIVGAGGVGSWLAPAVCLLVRPENVVIIDGDALEPGNLNRQLFDTDALGMNKAEALAEKYNCQSIGTYYYDGLMPDLGRDDWLLSCVDNHPARRSLLATCDQDGCQAVFGGNETTSAEAFYYQQCWKGSPMDPRVFYPEIATDEANDPRVRAVGCTGVIQETKRQLVTANLMAASLMGHLLAVWHLEAPKTCKELRKHLPFHLIQNLSQNQTRKEIDYVKNA